MTRRRQPEAALQRSVIAHLAWRARRPNVWWTHVPLGGLRSKVEAAILRGQGVTRGCPDLLIIADGKAHFLELKSAAGRVTAEQHACHEALRAAGADVAVAHGIDEALEQLEAWNRLRRSSGKSPRSPGARIGVNASAPERESSDEQTRREAHNRTTGRTDTATNHAG
jgi:hypothetical protein